MAAIELNASSLITDANLVAYWRMEGNSNDSKASYNGTDTGITYSTGNGKFTQGAGFNGTTSQISIANNAALCPAAFTFVAWINAVDLADAYNCIQGYEDATNGITVMVKSNGKVAVYLSGTGGINYDGTGVTTITTGSWFQIAYSYSGGTLVGYVNGAIDKTVTGGTWGATNPVTEPFYLGRSVTAGRFFNGAIDDAALFNRALTSDEVKYLYDETLVSLVPIGLPVMFA